MRSEFAHGRTLEHGADGDHFVETLRDRAHEARGQQRMTAEFEEVRRDADAIELQQFAPDRRERALGRRRRFGVVRRGRNARIGKMAFVHFAVRVQRQRIQCRR